MGSKTINAIKRKQQLSFIQSDLVYFLIRSLVLKPMSDSEQ